MEPQGELRWPAGLSAGQLAAITGGTTAAPRVVWYDAARWRRSIGVKAEILRAVGVDRGARVAVCHPFDPWSIGGVHREAALICGAHVLPIGLSGGSLGLQRILADFDPQFLCGPASLIARWGESLCRQGVHLRKPAQRVILHAGELLREADRIACEHAWSATVVNVYGLAELDAIGCELTRDRGMTLSPTYEYAIEVDSAVVLPNPGIEGHLLARASGECLAWIPTRDRVRVLGRAAASESLWPGALSVVVLGRLDGAISLPDGSVLSAEQVLTAESSLAADGVSRLQVMVQRADPASCTVTARYVLAPGSAVTEADVRAALLTHACDLADAVHHSAVLLAASMVDEESMRRTPRGKHLSVFEDEENSTVFASCGEATKSQERGERP